MHVDVLYQSDGDNTVVEVAVLFNAGTVVRSREDARLIVAPAVIVTVHSDAQGSFLDLLPHFIDGV